MLENHRKPFYHRLRIILVILFALTLPAPVIAEDEKVALADTRNLSEDRLNVNLGIGVLTLIGLDLRLLMRKGHSPLAVGVRYLNIKDDFVNESAAGLPNNASDKLYTQRAGLEVNYLFRPQSNHSFYVSGGLFVTTETLKCDTESDSESSAAPFVGGGYQGHWLKGFGYQLGLLFSPFSSTNLKTTNCESQESGDFDVNASLVFSF